MRDSTALARREGVDTSTGEIVPLAGFNVTAYLDSISTRAAFAMQNKMAAAYDAACSALVGPNDVQQEGARTFKKKSAWRKLARHFGISCELVRIERETLPSGDFLATVVARAVAPWGQHYEEVGACCTDEATGRRVITVADAIATASTRASNRAVSNLIAMGEVSAEEIGDRGEAPAPRARAASSGGGRRMPFGKPDVKGKLLSEIADDKLASAASWCSETEEKRAKFADLIADIYAELDQRKADDGDERYAEEDSGR